MIRPIAFASTLLALATSLPATAQPVHTPSIACRVLLPEAPIPGDPTRSVLILEITVAAGHDAHRHQHDAVEYLHVISGSGSLLVDGRPETPLGPGSVVVVPRRTPHQARNASETLPLVYTATFVETDEDQTVTVYVGENDSLNGCPHQRQKT